MNQQFQFQFPINEKLFDRATPGHVKYFFVGNLNICYERNGPDLELKWITWQNDDIKTQVQDLIRAIAPDLYEQIVEAMHQNFEVANKEPWGNGDADAWEVAGSEFE